MGKIEEINETMKTLESLLKSIGCDDESLLKISKEVKRIERKAKMKTIL